MLAGLLTELNWSPRDLARRLNRLYGPRMVAETAPYHWRDAGRVPRPPVPTYVAAVLGRELGRPISLDEPWQGRAAGFPGVLSADTGLGGLWPRDAVTTMLDDWVVCSTRRWSMEPWDSARR
ncbi:MAG: carph-isopro domain-containing protein [Nocardioidaceae bacterium]